MCDVPNGEDEEEEFKILYDEAVFDPDYSLKGGDRYCYGDTECQSGICVSVKILFDCLKMPNPWLMI